LTSKANKSRWSWTVFVTAALVVTTASLFAATTFLYLDHSRQRQMLAVSIRTSGWVAYQAQIELIKTLAALQIDAVNPSMVAQENVLLRIEILRSRLPILYESEEGQLLTEMPLHVPVIRAYEKVIDDFLAEVEDQPDVIVSPDRLNRLHDDLQPLNKTLQKILQTSVAYNKEIYKREQELSRSPAFVPLVMMFFSVAALVTFVLLQAMRDRQRLLAVERAQAEAAHMQENLRALIRAMPALVVVFDALNNAVSFANLQAQTLIDAAPPTSAEWRRFLRAAQDAITGTEAEGLVVNFSFQRANGSILALRGRRQSVMWEGRQQCLLALADTTQIRDAELQIMQAAKLATLGEMASAIAHEINQPLTVIRMAAANAQRLLANGDTTSLEAKLTRINEQIERARRITDQVRRYGRTPTSSMEPFLLRRAIDLAISFVAEQYGMSGIRLVIDLDLPADLQVSGEQTLFEQVIVNLLINARDAFEENRSKGAHPIVRVEAGVEDDRVALRIQDQAGGIREDILRSVFDPFVTTKSASHGTGLGLSLSRKIIRGMGGEIVASNAAGGAVFAISLPVHPSASLVNEAAQ
jgi:C4-dicarboxylate-specific signal transduction histidine kinase